MRTCAHTDVTSQTVIYHNPVIHDTALPSFVAKTKLDKALVESTQDFKKEWKSSMDVPIGVISEHSSRLKTGGRDVVVTPRVPGQDVTLLHNRLKEIDSK